jgi:hypothetical protein
MACGHLRRMSLRPIGQYQTSPVPGYPTALAFSGSCDVEQATFHVAAEDTR